MSCKCLHTPQNYDAPVPAVCGAHCLKISRFRLVCLFGSSPVNAAGETPVDMARRFKNAECKDLVGGGKGA